MARKLDKIYHCRIRAPQEVGPLAHRLAQYFPQPEPSFTGIYELLLNAVEHGNLGIGFELKTELIRAGIWHEELMRRLALPHYAHRRVEAMLMRDMEECRLTIIDQGDGFSWSHYLARTENERRPNGRGLQIAFNSEFDRILFNPRGNIVTCAARYDGLPLQKIKASADYKASAD